MTKPAELFDRLRDLEARFNALRDDFEERNSPGDGTTWRHVFYARTYSMSPDDYPDEGQNPNVYPIVFVDTTYFEGVGNRTTFPIDQSSNSMAFALYEGKQYLPYGTFCHVMQQHNGLYMIMSLENDAGTLLDGTVIQTDIQPDQSGDVQLRGSGEIITAHLEWITGGEKISGGKNVRVIWKEDHPESPRYVIVDAECEDPPGTTVVED